MRKFFEVGGIVAAIVLIAFGAAAIILGVNGKNTVGTELKNQQIVGTPDMTPKGIAAEVKGQPWAKGFALPTCTVAGLSVNNGDRARCFAQYMRIHTLEATQGVPYALMPHYATADGKGTNDSTKALLKDGQPVSNAARDIWVTETALTTALNASYMAEQMANFGIVVGFALLLAGLGFGILMIGGALENKSIVRFFTGSKLKAPAVPVA